MEDVAPPKIGSVPAELVLRVCEALLSETTPEERGTERIWQGVPLKYMVLVSDSRFERHMLIGRDWNCGFNLVHVDHGVAYPGESTYGAIGANFFIRQVGMEGEAGFNRDMTVLRMTYYDWRLPSQPPLSE